MSYYRLYKGKFEGTKWII